MPKIASQCDSGHAMAPASTENPERLSLKDTYLINIRSGESALHRTA